MTTLKVHGDVCIHAMVEHKTAACIECGTVREMPADHDMCMDCWEENGEPLAGTY